VSDWILDPFVSFGPLRFGASPADVHSALDESPREFQKGFSPNKVEAYAEAGVHAHYDDADQLEFIESFPPCRPIYAGVDLLRPDAALVVEELEALDLRVRSDDEGGLWFDEHGFALYAPGGLTEAVSAFRRGYDTRS
jgi:hypothetical protein